MKLRLIACLHTSPTFFKLRFVSKLYVFVQVPGRNRGAVEARRAATFPAMSSKTAPPERPQRISTLATAVDETPHLPYGCLLQSALREVVRKADHTLHQRPPMPAC